MMRKNKRTTLSFFIDGFVRLFIGSALFILFLDIGITVYQLSRVRPIVEARYHKLVTDHRSLFLNQIALDRVHALRKNMGYLRSEMGVDKLVLHYKNEHQDNTVSTSSRAGFSSTERIVAKILSDTGLLKPYNLTLTSDFGNVKAKVTVFYSVSLTKIFILPLITSALLLYIIALIPIGIIFLLLFRSVNEILVRPLQLLTKAFGTKTPRKTRLLSDTTTTLEIDQLISASDGYIEAKLKSAEALNALAAQVAHDIRSTLYSLEMVAKDLSGLPENKKILIREATNHIKETIHNLESDYPQDRQAHTEINTVLLMKIVDYVIGEKQEILSRGITLSYNFNTFAYSAFVRVIPQELTRVLSNILNNAIEASKDNSQITLTIKPNNYFVRIVISDSGYGISKDKLDSVFKQGITYKKNGKGLGLYHAKNNILGWGGQINIDSSVEKGTDVIIDLPLQKAQEWFAPGFSVFRDMPIVLLDDAKEVHAAWKERFASVFNKNCPEIISFYSPDRFISWYKHKRPTKALYLIDYEYGKLDTTGIDIINLMDQSSPTLLVTSRSNQPDIHQDCINAGVKLVPKFFIKHIPISVIDISPDLIIVEPSESLMTAYKHRAQVKNKNLLCYETLERFMCDSRLFTNTKLYIAEELLRGINITNLFSKLDTYTVFITSYSSSNPQNLRHFRLSGYVEKTFDFE